MTTAIINWNHRLPKIAITFDCDNRFEFYDKLLQNDLRDFGIYIPIGFREQFENKIYVALPDPSKATTTDIKVFRKAFEEVYFPQNLQDHKFTKSILQR